ncbi:unnamed protein product [Cochlearia groenlandica]
MLIPGWVVPTLASLGFSRYLFLASVVNQLFPFQHTLWRAIIHTPLLFRCFDQLLVFLTRANPLCCNGGVC